MPEVAEPPGDQQGAAGNGANPSTRNGAPPGPPPPGPPSRSRTRVGSAKYHDIASSLLGSSANIDELFLTAARDGDYSKIEHLLQRCSDVIISIDVKDKRTGNTALIWAARKGHTKIVNLLLRHGADPTLRNYEGHSALELGSMPVKTMLLDSVEKVSESSHRILLQAAWQGNIAIVRKLLHENKVLDINCQNAEGLTPLMLVTRDIQLFERLSVQLHRPYHPVAVAVELLGARANIRMTDNDGKTCMHYACQSKATITESLVDTLIHGGFELDLRDKRQYAALHWASHCGNTSVITRLLEGGSQVNARGFAGLTPLHITAHNDHLRSAVVLLQHGANVTSKDDRGYTPIDLAKSRKMKSTLKEAWTEATQSQYIHSLGPIKAHSRDDSRPSVKSHRGEVIFDENFSICGIQTFQRRSAPANPFTVKGGPPSKKMGMVRSLSNAEKAKRAEQQMAKDSEQQSNAPNLCGKENVRRLGTLRTPSKTTSLPSVPCGSATPTSSDRQSPESPRAASRGSIGGDLRRSLEDSRNILFQRHRLMKIVRRNGHSNQSITPLSTQDIDDISIDTRGNSRNSPTLPERSRHSNLTSPSVSDLTSSCDQYLSRKGNCSSSSPEDCRFEELCSPTSRMPALRSPMDRQMAGLNIPSTIHEVQSVNSVTTARPAPLHGSRPQTCSPAQIMSLYPNSNHILPSTPTLRCYSNAEAGKGTDSKEGSPRQAVNFTFGSPSEQMLPNKLLKEEFVLEESRPRDPMTPGGSDPPSTCSSLSSASPREASQGLASHKPGPLTRNQPGRSRSFSGPHKSPKKDLSGSQPLLAKGDPLLPLSPQMARKHRSSSDDVSAKRASAAQSVSSRNLGGNAVSLTRHGSLKGREGRVTFHSSVGSAGDNAGQGESSLTTKSGSEPALHDIGEGVANETSNRVPPTIGDPSVLRARQGRLRQNLEVPSTRNRVRSRSDSGDRKPLPPKKFKEPFSKPNGKYSSVTVEGGASGKEKTVKQDSPVVPRPQKSTFSVTSSEIVVDVGLLQAQTGADPQTSQKPIAEEKKSSNTSQDTSKNSAGGVSKKPTTSGEEKEVGQSSDLSLHILKSESHSDISSSKPELQTGETARKLKSSSQTSTETPANKSSQNSDSGIGSSMTTPDASPKAPINVKQQIKQLEAVLKGNSNSGGKVDAVAKPASFKASSVKTGCAGGPTKTSAEQSVTVGQSVSSKQTTVTQNTSVKNAIVSGGGEAKSPNMSSRKTSLLKSEIKPVGGSQSQQVSTAQSSVSAQGSMKRQQQHSNVPQAKSQAQVPAKPQRPEVPAKSLNVTSPKMQHKYGKQLSAPEGSSAKSNTVDKGQYVIPKSASAEFAKKTVDTKTVDRISSGQAGRESVDSGVSSNFPAPSSAKTIGNSDQQMAGTPAPGSAGQAIPKQPPPRPDAPPTLPPRARAAVKPNVPPPRPTAPPPRPSAPPSVSKGSKPPTAPTPRAGSQTAVNSTQPSPSTAPTQPGSKEPKSRTAEGNREPPKPASSQGTPKVSTSVSAKTVSSVLESCQDAPDVGSPSCKGQSARKASLDSQTNLSCPTFTPPKVELAGAGSNSGNLSATAPVQVTDKKSKSCQNGAAPAGPSSNVQKQDGKSQSSSAGIKSSVGNEQKGRPGAGPKGEVAGGKGTAPKDDVKTARIPMKAEVVENTPFKISWSLSKQVKSALTDAHSSTGAKSSKHEAQSSTPPVLVKVKTCDEKAPGQNQNSEKQQISPRLLMTPHVSEANEPLVKIIAESVDTRPSVSQSRLVETVGLMHTPLIVNPFEDFVSNHSTYGYVTGRPDKGIPATDFGFVVTKPGGREGSAKSKQGTKGKNAKSGAQKQGKKTQGGRDRKTSASNRKGARSTGSKTGDQEDPHGRPKSTRSSRGRTRSGKRRQKKTPRDTSSHGDQSDVAIVSGIGWQVEVKKGKSKQTKTVRLRDFESETEYESDFESESQGCQDIEDLEDTSAGNTPRFREVRDGMEEKIPLPKVDDDGFPPMNLDLTQGSYNLTMSGEHDDITNALHKEILLGKLTPIPEAPSLTKVTKNAIARFDSSTKADDLEKMLGASKEAGASAATDNPAPSQLKEQSAGKKSMAGNRTTDSKNGSARDRMASSGKGGLGGSGRGTPLQRSGSMQGMLSGPLEAVQENAPTGGLDFMELKASLAKIKDLRDKTSELVQASYDGDKTERTVTRERKFSETKIVQEKPEENIDDIVDEILSSTGTMSLTSTLRSTKGTLRSTPSTLTDGDRNVLRKLQNTTSLFHAKKSEEEGEGKESSSFSDETNPNLLKVFHADNFPLGTKVKAMVEAGADQSKIISMLNQEKQENQQLARVVNSFRNMELVVPNDMVPSASKMSRQNKKPGAGRPPTPNSGGLGGHVRGKFHEVKDMKSGTPRLNSQRQATDPKAEAPRSEKPAEPEASGPFLGVMANPEVLAVAASETMRGRLGRRGSHSGSACTSDSLDSFRDETIQWKKGNVLGRGAFGTVWCGLTSEGELIAVKQIELNTTDREKAEREYEKVQEEVELLKTLNHKNIVGYLGTSLEDSIVSIFMQFVPGGSIASILARFGALEETVFMRYTRQILQGVEYLHANDVIHRDIKGGNVMLMPNGIIKLIDFGCAKRLCFNLSLNQMQILKSMKGTPYWMAPEVVSETGHGKKSDIWSVGCTVFEMATRKPPWADMNPMAAIFAIGSDRPVPQLPERFSAQARDFVNCCLTRDQNKRPSATEILFHPFVCRATKRGTFSSTE